MRYYHIIKSYQKLKLTLNVVVHVTFNYMSYHQFYYAMSYFLVKMIVEMICVKSLH